MKKYYAVKIGKNPGIYDNWSDTEKQVKGYPNAKYKGFTSLEDAQAFLQEDANETKKIENDSKKSSEEPLENYVEIFVDGSYAAEEMVYGSGWVAVKNDEVLYKKSFSGNDKRYVSSRQVPGEIFACIDAINWAKEHGFDEVIISYDYEGIEAWATKRWKAEKPISIDYVLLYDQASTGIKVTFKKVKAHSGVNFNEVADKLAKSSLLKKGIRTNRDGGVTLLGIDRDELEMVYDLIEKENPEYKLLINTEAKGCINYTLSSGDDRVIINCYDTGKAVVQGRNSSFMQYVLTLLIQLCDSDEEVIETLNSFNRIEVNKDIVEEKFNSVLPNYKLLSNKLDKTLRQAAYNLTLDGVRYDYSDLPMPILRSIDYFLHDILSSIGLRTVTQNGVNNFSFFDCGHEKVYSLQQVHASKFDDEKKCIYLNELYNFYRVHRHTLFHWDEESEQTRVLNTIEEARNVLKQGFELIDKYFVIFI